MFSQFLEVSDDYKSPIILNDRYVFSVNPSTIQITKDLRFRYPDKKNNLHIVYKKAPVLNKAEGDANNQYVDIPPILIECVILGMAKFAHSSGLLTTDQRVGGSYIVNPYLERYELAIKKAFENGFIVDRGMHKRTVQTKGFI